MAFPACLWGQGQSELHWQSSCAAGRTAEAQSAQSTSCPVTVKDDPTLTRNYRICCWGPSKTSQTSLSAFSLSFFSFSHMHPEEKRVKEKNVPQVTFLSTLVAFKPTMSPSDAEQRSGLLSRGHGTVDHDKFCLLKRGPQLAGFEDNGFNAPFTWTDSTHTKLPGGRPSACQAIRSPLGWNS